MALNLSFGGDGNEYVKAASQAAQGSKGGPSIIATVLDALGIGRQVAKGPKDLSESQTPEGKADSQQKKVAKAQESSEEPVQLSALTEAETALGVQPLAMTQPVASPNVGAPSQGPTSPWGVRYLESLKPLISIDPDVGAVLGNSGR